MFKQKMIIFLLSLVTIICIGNVLGQLNPYAPPSAIDNLSGASTGPNPTAYINRARVAAGQPVPANAPAAPPTSPVGATAYGAMPPAAPGIAPQGTPLPGGPVSTPQPRLIKVRAGERIYCHVCGLLLQDAVEKDVPEDQKAKYYDDGTHGDAEANDGIYSNIVERKDVLGPVCNELLQRTVATIRNAEQLSPLEFYRLHATADDRLSMLPKSRDEERERDMRLKEWNDKFLRSYRKNPNDSTSEFYPVYVPPPPELPKVPPPTAPQPQQGQPGAPSAPPPNVGGYGGAPAPPAAPVGVTAAPQNPAATSHY